MVSQLANELYCTKHWWGVYEQNRIIKSIHDWTAEWAIIPNNVNEDNKEIAD